MTDDNITPATPRPYTPGQRYTVRQMERASELVNRMSAARRAARFYPAEHPSYDMVVRELMTAVVAYLDEDCDIHLGFVDGEILMGEQLLTQESVSLSQFTEELMAMGVGSVIIRCGVTMDEVAAAMRILSYDEPTIEAAGGVTALATAANLEHVVIGSMRTVQRDKAGMFRMPASARASYRSSVSLIHEFDGAHQREVEIDPAKIDAAVRALIDNVLDNRDAMLQLAGMRDYDHYTYQHSANVAALSLAVGSLISKDPKFLSALGVGALLHDVGKLAVGPDVLNKPGALDDAEWERMRRHPVEGAEIVAALPGVDRAAIVAIAEHHMRFDGAGYPSRPVARKQHLVSRIVAVADAYDAMTSRRSYSGARLPNQAMELLVKSAGTALDPAIVRLFVRLMGVYPPRSVVRLNTGEIAIVLKANAEDASRPLVRVVAAPSGHVLDGIDVDLAQAPDKSVTACLDPQSVSIDIEAYVS